MKLSFRLAAIAGLFVALGFAPLAQGAPQSCEGITAPIYDLKLSLPVPGIMSTQHFTEGQFVQTNDVILELDSKIEQLEVERRRIAMEYLKHDAETTKKVFDKTSAVSHDELLKRQADYEASVTEYEHAKEDLRRRKLFPPVAGRITEINLHIGESCTPYESIVHLVDTRQCLFTTSVEVKLASKLKQGDIVQIEIEDEAKPVKVEAKIIFISAVVDAASGLQTVKAQFDNPDEKVKPGVTGKMLID